MQRSDPPLRWLMQGAQRWAWLTLAWVCLGLAVLGVLLPGLPTTPFVLVAAWAASRGSPRLHRWLLAHRLFGPLIRDWQAEGAVSRRAKYLAVATMLFCAAIMIAFTPHWAFAAVGCVFMAVIGSWLWLRPEPGMARRSGA